MSSNYADVGGFAGSAAADESEQQKKGRPGSFNSHDPAAICATADALFARGGEAENRFSDAFAYEFSCQYQRDEERES